MKCEKCGIDIDGKYGSGRFCSKSCANSRTHSEQTKINISNGVRNSETFLSNNLIAVKKRRENWLKNRTENTVVKKIHTLKVVKENGAQYVNGGNKECVVCKRVMKRKNKKYCSKVCYLSDANKPKVSGGFRLNSGRGKCGWYKDIYCGSSYELAWVMYNLDHNIPFERNTEGFDYEFNGVTHKYYPDFKIDEEYIEIKGFKRENDDAKWECFPHKLNILFKKDMKQIIKYVIEKYGKDFIELYEINYRENKKRNKCVICGNHCLNLVCGRSCSGKRVAKIIFEKRKLV
jgi:hypothetical protein